MKAKKICPRCKWDFHFRKKGKCPGCGATLMLPSDRWTEVRPTKEYYALDYPSSTGRWHYIDDMDKAVQRAMLQYEAAMQGERKQAEEKELARTLSRYGPD